MNALKKAISCDVGQGDKNESRIEFFAWVVANIILLAMIIFASFFLVVATVRIGCSSLASFDAECVNFFAVLESFDPISFVVSFALSAICGVVYSWLGFAEMKISFLYMACYFGGMSVVSFVICIFVLVSAFRVSPFLSFLVAAFFFAVVLGIGFFCSSCKDGSAQKAMISAAYEMALLAFVVAVLLWLVGYAEGDTLIGKIVWIFGG